MIIPEDGRANHAFRARDWASVLPPSLLLMLLVKVKFRACDFAISIHLLPKTLEDHAIVTIFGGSGGIDKFRQITNLVNNQAVKWPSLVQPFSRSNGYERVETAPSSGGGGVETWTAGGKSS